MKYTLKRMLSGRSVENMKMLDLFNGGGSVCSVFRERGWDVVTLDIDSSNNPDICADIMDVNPLLMQDKYGHFDFIWASPPCECFSVASIGKHWHKGGIPKTEKAQQAKCILRKTKELIEVLSPPFWLIENPRGMMRKMDILILAPRVTVTYCQYGDDRMKPTDLFGVMPDNWTPKQPCKNGAPCHTPAPRGSRTGTQGRKTYLDRSAIPKQLVKEVATSIEEKLLLKEGAK